MKKMIFLFFILLGTVTFVKAQRYSVIKKNYDYHLYKPQPNDPYNPVISGVCSFFVPGLGQIVEGEVGRGLGFLGGAAGCFIVMGTGELLLIGTGISLIGGEDSNKSLTPGTALLCIGMGGLVAVDIWSIIDASHVAKVKNMHYQDNKIKANLGLELKPYIQPVTINNQVSVPVGLSLKVSFK